MPVAVTFWVSALFTLNHFHYGAYVQDSGWYSAIVWRSGALPPNPAVVSLSGTVPSYYGVHSSLLVSVASMASYLFPGDRVTWYCLFQGAIFAPLGAVTALLVGRRNVTASVGMFALTMLVALAFALNGQVLACLGYPHFEIFIPVGTSLMLVGIATARERLAWVGLAASVVTREDGGFQAALFLAAVLGSGWLRAPFPIANRRLLVMGAVAVGGSLFAFVIQKTCFVGVNLFRHEYVGEDAYAHLSGPVLIARTKDLFEHARFVVYPFIATVLVAAMRRDGRYLLGWLATLPWFLLNFLAAQELKAVFSIYTGFPFVTSIAWVGAYSLISPRKQAAHATLAAVGAVSLVATLGYELSLRGGLEGLARMSRPPSTSHSAYIAFAAPLRADPDVFGKIWLDDGAAAWTIESARYGSWLTPSTPNSEYASRTGYAFVLYQVDSELLRRLAIGRYVRCGSFPSTRAFLCVREDEQLPGAIRVASPILSGLSLADHAVRRDGNAIVIDAEAEPTCAAFGPFTKLVAGRYRARWTTELGACPQGRPAANVDVAFDMRAVATAAVEPSGTMDLRFDVPKGASPVVEFRAWTGPCGYRVTDLSLQREE